MAPRSKQPSALARDEIRNLRVLSIVGMMIVSFAVSYAFMSTRRSGESADVGGFTGGPATAALPGTGSTLQGRPDATAGQTVPAAPSPTPSPSTPSPAHSAAESAVQSGQLPVAIQIRKWGGGFKYLGDVQNLDDKPHSVTMSVTSSATGTTSQIQLDLGPGEKRNFTSGAGFDFRAGDELVLRSPEFADRFERVP